LDDEAPQSSAKALLEPVMRGGVRVTPLPSLEEARRHCRQATGALPAQLRGLAAEASYPVKRSPTLTLAG
jgi:hypothetical protein